MNTSTASSKADNSSHFGYEQIEADEKQPRVNGVFDSVAKDYDRMNDVMSLGLHRAWKRAFVKQLAPKGGEQILDMAGGTGDIASRIMQQQPGAQVTVSDINQEMLDVGKKRQLDKGITIHDWQCQNAESLTFDSQSFDAYTIAFGIRNVPDISAALSEAYRVLKFGGRFQCLEFSQVRLTILKSIYDAYSFKLIPFMGEKIANDRDAYQYLVESIRQFPSRETFVEMIADAGFDKVECRALSGGAVAIHSGWKL